MQAVARFEFILLLLVAIIALELVAARLRIPPAAALIVGGVLLAFVPGVPTIALDPDLMLVLFLPPLLMDGAFSTAIVDFRRHLGGILSLAVGAVAFTTALVGVAAHWAVPSLPWAACFALGAVVSPPDAVAAKAILEQVRLPRRLVALLEGESLLNDAAGLVVFRFAVAAALTGGFDAGAALGTFALLAVGGVALGILFGRIWIFALGRMHDTVLTIAAVMLLPWAAYILGDLLHVSGVIATVTAGLVFGWRQHAALPAATRARGQAFFQVLVFLLEAFVFILIGLSLRGVVEHFGGVGAALATLARPVGVVLAAVVGARFVWVLASDGLVFGVSRWRGPGAAFPLRSSLVMGWAGMRGVVTLAVALSVPAGMAGREFILAAAFATILVTVLLQGTSMGLLIRLLKLPPGEERDPRHLTRAEAVARMAEVQAAALKPLAEAASGSRSARFIFDQFTARAEMLAQFSEDTEGLVEDRRLYFDMLLAALAAGRAEILRLRQAGRLHDHELRYLERSLDPQERFARQARPD